MPTALPIIDGDGHFVEPVGLWSEYVPLSMRDRIHAITGADGYMESLVLGDHVRDYRPRPHPFDKGDTLRPGGLRPGQTLGRRYEDAEPGGWDATRRLAVHDAENIVAAVLFPTLGLQLGSLTDADVALTACQAINRWAADYAAAAPGELHVVASLPDHFPSLGAAELRRCVEEHGFVAAAMRPNPTVDGRRLDHPDFEVVWQTAVDLDVPVCIHDVGALDRPQLGADRSANFLVQHAAIHSFEGMMAFATLYQGEVFTRHPTLRVGFMESGCGWAPFWVERLHEHAKGLGWLIDPPAQRDPAEIFAAQCVVTCEGEESMVPYVQERLGDQSVLWASDFPHFDTEPPFSADIVNRTDMTDRQREAVLHGAATAFYRLDWDHIQERNASRRGAALAAR
jgi:predicted TIM-barrel fold metal-dependent hydrolase